MAFKGFLDALLSLVKRFWLPFFLLLFVVVIFGGGLFLWVYRAVRSAVANVSPAAGKVLPVK